MRKTRAWQYAYLWCSMPSIWWALKVLEPEMTGCHNSFLVSITAKRVDTAAAKAKSIAQRKTLIAQLHTTTSRGCVILQLDPI